MSNMNDTQRIWLDNSFLNDSQPTEPPKKKRRWIVPLILLICVLLIAFAAAAILTYKLSQLEILDNVSIAGVDVGGMTKDEAITAVTNAVGNSYATTDMTVVAVGKEYSIPAEYSGGTLNIEEAVKEARSFGHFSKTEEREKEKQLAATEGYALDLGPYMQVNESAIRAILQQIADDYDSDLKQTEWTINGNEPTEEELKAGEVELQLQITMGTADYLFDLDAMYDTVIACYNSNEFQATLPCEITEPDSVDVDSIFQQHAKEAVNAYLDPDTYAFIEESNGYGFDVEVVKKQLESAKYGDIITAEFELYEATYSVEQLHADLFKDVLATTTAENSSQGGRDVNLKLACESINGLIINPGEVFDYNKALGERTPERGYKGGAAYQGGKTVYVTGGGICQVSSTLYCSVVIADLEIVTRENHGYAVGYLPLGIDATVSWGGPEFRFRNNSDRPIMIEAYSNKGTVTVSIRGIDDKDYYVKFENEVLASYGWNTVYETMKADNPEGHKDGDVLTTPYTGYETKTYRAKYDKKTDALISRELEAHSFYNKRDKVVVKIEQEPAPSDPTESTTPSA